MFVWWQGGGGVGGAKAGGREEVPREEQVSPEAMFFQFDSRSIPVCAYQLHRSVIPRNKRPRLQHSRYENNL